MRALVLAILLGLVAVRPVAADAPTVTLPDAGKGAKKPLRFKVRKGVKKTVVARMTMGLTMDLAGSPMAQDMPPIDMTFVMKITDVAANGDIRYDITFKRPRVVATSGTPKAVVTAMTDAMKGVEGITGYSVVSERGFVKATELAVPATAAPQIRQMIDSMKQSFEQMSTPVPEEAVGVGAKWDTKTSLTSNGLVIDQTTTNTIVAVAGNKATLDIDVVQTAKPQKFSANGISADLQSYTASGHGTSVFDFAALVPAKAQMGMKSNMKMTAAGQNIGVALTLDMALTAK
ncbi:MAG TPA: DUF6263 family protein [Kofleriaceae bacterium]|nr:DUF6263 family protein [Kofleriaceae bacterium]